ncbi:MAG TPA: flagellar basal body P-ring formation chaperone FlgA [Steroidobacteraceae bacterium]|nr:flagellar basal body P-ring formation chaperone FlgA [Steroidobacteraceae bacterium]
MISIATKNRRRVLAAAALLCAAAAGAQPAGDEGIEPLDRIGAAAEALVRAQLPARAEVVSVTSGPLDGRLRLTRCAQPLKAQLPAGASLQSRALIGVSCESPSRWSVYVPVTIETRVPVLVLKHAVARDVIVGPDDVSVESRRVSGLGTAYLGNPSELHHRAVQRSLAAGTALTVDLLAPDFAIHRGQEVTLVAAAGGIEVRATGRALDNATAGARLKVQNLSSMRIVEGVAEDAATVRIAP